MHDFNGQFYAFADDIMRTPGLDTIHFDIFRAEQMPFLKKMHTAERPWLAELETWSLLAEIHADAYDRLPGLGGRRIQDNRWYTVTLGDDAIARSYIYGDVTADEPLTSIGLSGVGFLPLRSSDARFLEAVVSLRGNPDTSADQIQAILNGSQLRGRPTTNTFVACYNVGQGNCSAICQQDAYPLLYVDFGCGVLRNAKTFPKGMRPCLTSHQPIVLSHWDLDHWALALRFPNAEECKWIVPRQAPLGATHVKFAQRLHQKGSLLIWPSSQQQMGTAHGMIYKLPQNRCRNRSGLVMTAETKWQAPDPIRTLLPGDAPYRFIPTNAQTDLAGLVVSHHGGSHRGDTPPTARSAHKCSYSYGVGNSYRHPKQSAVRKHIGAGWTNHRDTPNGNVSLASKAPIPLAVPCGGANCTLSIQQ